MKDIRNRRSETGVGDLFSQFYKCFDENRQLCKIIGCNA